MSKAKLTTRAISTTTVTSDNLAKASQLTHNQLDSNFINLRDATFGVVADDSATIQVGMDSTLEIKGGTNITTATDSAGVVTITGAGTATSLTTDGLTIEDADIKGTRSNENIVIDPAGTGSVSINKVAITGGTVTGITDLVVADGGTGASSLTDNAVLTGTGTSAITAEGNLSFDGSTLAVTGAGTFSTTLGVTGASTLDGVTVNDNTIASNDSNSNLEISANGSGTVILENLKVGTGGATVTEIDNGSLGSSATKLATQGAIKTYVDSKSHTALSGSTNNTITTVTGANAIQGESNLQFDGSTLAVTGNQTISGNLTVSGDTTTVSTTNTTIADNIIELNSGLSQSLNDSGIIIERGSTGNNACMIWDESADEFVFGTTTATGSDKSSGLSITAGDLKVADITATGGSITGITDLVVADGGTGASTLTDNAVLTGTGTSAITAEGNLSFSGSTLAVTGAATVSTTLGVTGASTLDGVTVTDNTISSNDSNANLEINANGTGTVNLENLKIGTSGSTVTTILDEDAMGTNSATALATQQSIKAYVDGQTHTGATLTGSTNNTLTTVTGANAFQGEANAQFDGSTLAITGNITATTSIGNDAITINDNNITGTRSNEDIRITASGTGDVIIDTDALRLGSGSETGKIYSNGDNDLELSGGTDDEVKLTLTGSDSAAGASAVISNQQYNIIGTGSSQAKLTSRGDQPLRLMTDSGNGTAKLSIINDSGAEVTGTLSATGTITGDGALVVTGASTLGGISVVDHTITTSSSNANLFIEASGTGTIQLENLKIGTSGATVTTILDEDAMGTNSATALATQQSIKAYVDAQDHSGGGGIGDLSVVGSSLSSPSNADLTFLTSGSGDIILNEITIHDNTITNNDSNANFYITSNGTGDLVLQGGDDLLLQPSDDLKLVPGDDIQIVSDTSGKKVNFWNNAGATVNWYGNYSAVWNIYKADDAVHHWNETGTNDYPDTGDDLWTVNVYGATGTGVYDAGAGGKLLFEASADWSGSSRSTSFEIQLAQTGSTSLTTPFKIGATGDVVLTGGLTVGTSIENDAIKIDDHTISGLRSNDNIVIDPAGTGSVAMDKVAITGGTITGITDLVVADGGTGASSLTSDAVLTGTGASAITAESNLSFNGSTLAVTGNITALGTTTIDNLTFNDNIIGSSSNADISIQPGGTGNILAGAITINGTTLSAADSSKITLAEAVDITGAVGITSGTITGITDLTVADGGTGASSLTDNSVLTGTGTSAITAEGNLTFNGSTLGVTGNITATTTIAATTAITAGTSITATTSIGNDAITINDNKIQASRSNDVIYLQPNGTGVTNVGNADWYDDFGGLISGAYGSTSRLKGNAMYYVDEAIVPGADRTYANWIQTSLKTNGADTTSSNGRFRNICVMAMDLNGSSITHSNLSRGVQSMNCTAYITSSSTDDNVLSTATGFIGYGYVSPKVDTNLTLTNCMGVRSNCEVDASNLGGSKTALITNAYGFFYAGNNTYGTGGGGTATITNSYGYYADMNSDTGATNWAFYDNRTAGSNSQNRLGAIQLINQSGAPTHLANHSWIYALDDSASSEVYVKDEAGNATKISPHNKEGEWEYYSKNSVTGKTVRVNMEKMIRKLEEVTGESFIETI